MILFQVKENKNEKMPEAHGKFYAYPVITQTYDIDKLVAHMRSHNSPFSAGALKGILTDTVGCIRELALQGIAVKIDNLAIFSIGIKNKEGAKSEKDFSVAKNIEGLKLRARGTGDFTTTSLSLEANLKKVSSLSNSDSTDSPSGDDTPGSDSGTDTKPSEGGNTSGGGSTTPGGGSTSGGTELE